MKGCRSTKDGSGSILSYIIHKVLVNSLKIDWIFNLDKLKIQSTNSRAITHTHTHTHTEVANGPKVIKMEG